MGEWHLISEYKTFRNKVKTNFMKFHSKQNINLEMLLQWIIILFEMLVFIVVKFRRPSYFVRRLSLNPSERFFFNFAGTSDADKHIIIIID